MNSSRRDAERIQKLREQINEYRYQYHVHDRSIMSEAAADSLKHELAKLEQQYPEHITPDSPTQRVAGEPLAKFASVRHQSPMLSLQDVFDESETRAWAERITRLHGEVIDEFFIEIKKDGLAASLIYEDGLLAQGLTRGDGRTGEDVTTNLRTIESVPLRLRHVASAPPGVYRGRFEVRGEVVLPKKEFVRINVEREAKGLPLFANPRNTAAGAIRQLDPSLVASRKLLFLAYLVQTPIPGLETLAQEQELAAKLGFAVEKHGIVVRGVKGVMDYARTWEEKRRELPFETDGLVITVNYNQVFESLGVAGKAPRGQVAYKFPAEQATTKVRDIRISMGRTGAATPFAELEPVKVAGSTVQNATLHNEGEIKRKDIRIGDTVIIQKAGDIIPEVMQSLPKLRTGGEQVFVMPTHCPECGQLFDKKPEEAVWRCVNFDCPALAAQRIIHFVSKGALDIEGLGEKQVVTLLDKGLISDAADLFTLTYDQLIALERFADTSVNNLLSIIAERKTPALARFIFALGIRHVGQQTARDLAKEFKTFEALAVATRDDINAVSGIGVVVVGSIVDWFGSARHQRLLHKLFASGVRPGAEATDKVGPLQSMKFVITGSLSGMSRDEAGKRIEKLGGELQNTITKDTAYLVIADDPGGSKIAKAEKLGTKQIDEKELLDLLK